MRARAVEGAVERGEVPQVQVLDVRRERRQPDAARPALVGRIPCQPRRGAGQLAQRAGAGVHNLEIAAPSPVAWPNWSRCNCLAKRKNEGRSFARYARMPARNEGLPGTGVSRRPGSPLT